MHKLKYSSLLLVLALVVGILYVLGFSLNPDLLESYFYMKVVSSCYILILGLWAYLGLSYKPIIAINFLMLVLLSIFLMFSLLLGLVYLSKEIPNLIQPEVSVSYIVFSIVILALSLFVSFLGNTYLKFIPNNVFLICCIGSFLILTRSSLFFAIVVNMKNILSLIRLFFIDS